MRYPFLLIPLLLLCLATLSCNGTGSSSATSESSEVSQLEKQIAELEEQLDSVTAERDTLKSELKTTAALHEVALKENEYLAGQLQAAKADLIFARTEFKKAFAKFDSTLAQCRELNKQYAAKIDSFRTENQKLRLTLALQAQEISDLNRTLNHTQQWYDYYKGVSKRGILKHLFGAGKPPLPDVPDPGD